jgi:hypothetical protein
MPYTLATLISSCRILSGDGSSDNFSRSENLNNNDGAANGSNLIFYVQNQPIAPSGLVQLVVDNQLISSPYSDARIASIDEALGQIIFAAGHAPTTSVYANYYYYLFPDKVWQEFITAALEQLNFFNSGSQTLDVALSTVPDAFYAVVKLFVQYWFCMRVAQQTGLWYNQRLQERVDDRDNISKKWLQNAESVMKQGLAARTDAYQGSGSAAGPSFRIRQFQTKPWSPRR